MKEPIIIPLTKSLIESITPNEVIYAEVASGGAMGNAGGIMLYLVIEDALICYETNVFKDEEVYLQTEEILLKHQDRIVTSDKELQVKLFDRFNCGMGNYVFLNKNIALEIKEGYFIYKKENIEYQILASVQGVFHNLVYQMRKHESYEK